MSLILVDYISLEMFRKYQTTVEVKRLTTTSDTYNRKGYVSTGDSYIWHLKPLSIEKTQQIGDFWKSYKFTTESTADIQEGDRLVVWSVEYDVSGVVVCNWISFNSLQCLITGLW